MAARISIYHHYEGLNARTPKSKMRPRTCQDRFIRDVRHKKHAGGRPRVWHKCPWCSLKFTGRQWLSHEYLCASRPLRPEPEQVVDFGRVKKRVWDKPPVKTAQVPVLQEQVYGEAVVSSHL